MNPVNLEKLNPQQQLAVTARGQSLLVSAAAGSGKTFVLSRRIISQLFDAEKPMDADHLLVVTFTNAAAAEMKSRIVSVLAELAIEYPDNEDILRQQMLIEGARICTIDSFCMELTRRYAADLQLADDFSIGDQNRNQVLRERVLTEVLEEQYRAGGPAFAQLTANLSKTHDRPLRELIEQVDAFLQSLPFPDDWMTEKLAMYSASADPSVWLDILWRQADDSLEYAQNLLINCARVIDDIESVNIVWQAGIAQHLQVICELQEQVHLRDFSGMTAALKALSFNQIRTPNGYGDVPEVVTAKEFRNRAKATLDKLSKWFCLSAAELAAQMESLHPVSKKLFELVSLFRSRLLEEKKKAGLFEYADIEAFAASLLFMPGAEGVVPTPLAQELSEEIAEIFIDEFQDINQLQYHLFSALAREDNLFLVGDVKQSIYRFRQASPEIFMKLKENWPPFEESDGSQAVISLPVNYRSCPAVIDALNFCFRQLMRVDTAEIEYNAEEELVCGEPEKHDPPGLFSLLLIDTDGQTDSAISEGRTIAKEIHALMAHEKVPEKNGPRPIRYSDICILVRSRSENDELMTGLREFEIPVIGDESGDFFKLPEILSVISVLRAVNNPTRDIPLLAAMMSPFYAFTPDEMALIRGKERQKRLYAALLEYSVQKTVLGEKCKAFLDQLSVFRRLSTLLGTAELIHTIADMTGFYAAAAAMKGGGDRAENVRRLVCHAEEFEANASRSLSAFIRYLDRLTASLGSRNDGLEGAADADQVRIITIHHAKGLEYPVCFVACGHKKFNVSDSRLAFAAHRDIGFGMTQTASDGTYTYIPLIKTAILEQGRLDNIAEEMRIRYVALSRAKSRLILTIRSSDPVALLTKCAAELAGQNGIPKQAIQNADSPGKWFLMATLLHPSGEVLRKQTDIVLHPIQASDIWDVRIVSPPESPVLAAAEDENIVVPFDETMIKQIDHRLSWVYPQAELTTLLRKFTVSQLAKGKTDRTEQLAVPDFAHQESGASRGSATHRFMEECDFALAAADIGNEIARLIKTGRISEREGGMVNRQTTASFFASPLYQRIANAQSVARERDFITQIPAGRVKPELTGASSAETVILQGCADCVVFEEDGLVLIDYKTDRIENPQDFIDHYALQLQLYAEAISALYAQPVKQKFIFSFHLGQEIPIV